VVREDLVLVRHIVADHTDHRVEVLEEELRNGQVEVQGVHYSHHVVEGTVVLAEDLEERQNHAVEGIAGLEEDLEVRRRVAAVGMEVVLGEDIVGRSPAEDTVGRSLAVRNS
jgi:hypothetical protein